MESDLEYFAKQMEKRFKPYLEKLAQEIKQEFFGFETRVNVSRSADLTQIYDFSLILQLINPEIEPYFTGVDNDQVLGTPILYFALKQRNSNEPPKVNSGVFLDGAYGREIGNLFENAIQVTPEILEEVISQIELKMPKLKELLWSGIKFYLDFHISST